MTNNGAIIIENCFDNNVIIIMLLIITAVVVFALAFTVLSYLHTYQPIYQSIDQLFPYNVNRRKTWSVFYLFNQKLYHTFSKSTI